MGEVPEDTAQTAVPDREITAKIDTAELRREWEERAERARNITLTLSMGAKTDLGRVRENNEDKFEFFVPEDEESLASKGCFYAVADGMGGHNAGQIASELALKTAIDAYYSDSSPLVDAALKSAFGKANALIFDAARAITERSGMGTTMTALVLRGEEAFVAHVGDSRCYRVRRGAIRLLTDDHSWVNQQVKSGVMSEEDALVSPFRNVITRSLGISPSVDVDVTVETLKAGDTFLLCSDGLSGELSADDMLEAVYKSAPSRAAWDLVNLALERGGHDNITALVVAVQDIQTAQQPRRRGLGALLRRD